MKARLALIAAAVAGLGVLIAGCGGGKGPAVAAIGTTTSSDTPPATNGGGGSGGAGSAPSSSRSALSIGGVKDRSSLMKFASCMRSHGVPNFPDPNAQGVISISPDSGISKDSSQLRTAQEACRKYLPNDGTPTPAQQQEARAQALAFSACMRKNGLPNFPDPHFGPGGQVEIQVGSSSGLNKNSQQFQHAMTACQKDLPGRLNAGKQTGSNSSGGK